MILQVDETLAIEVHFDPADREAGFADDIRFALSESGPAEFRLFPADEIAFLLTPEQAEQLAAALQQAAAESQATPRQWA
jgi:hypothetical protein